MPRQKAKRFQYIIACFANGCFEKFDCGDLAVYRGSRFYTPWNSMKKTRGIVPWRFHGILCEMFYGISRPRGQKRVKTPQRLHGIPWKLHGMQIP